MIIYSNLFPSFRRLKSLILFSSSPSRPTLPSLSPPYHGHQIARSHCYLVICRSASAPNLLIPPIIISPASNHPNPTASLRFLLLVNSSTLFVSFLSFPSDPFRSFLLFCPSLLLPVPHSSRHFFFCFFLLPPINDLLHSLSIHPPHSLSMN